jgi:hypothetical protein
MLIDSTLHLFFVLLPNTILICNSLYQDPSSDYSGYLVKYGNNEVVLLGGAAGDSIFSYTGSFGSSATHMLGSCSTKKRGKKGGKMTTIQASLNKSGASYPGPGSLIGVVLALNVLIVSFLSTVM